MSNPEKIQIWVEMFNVHISKSFFDKLGASGAQFDEVAFSIHNSFYHKQNLVILVWERQHFYKFLLK